MQTIRELHSNRIRDRRFASLPTGFWACPLFWAFRVEESWLENIANDWEIRSRTLPTDATVWSGPQSEHCLELYLRMSCASQPHETIGRRFGSYSMPGKSLSNRYLIKVVFPVEYWPINRIIGFASKSASSNFGEWNSSSSGSIFDL